MPQPSVSEWIADPRVPSGTLGGADVHMTLTSGFCVFIKTNISSAVRLWLHCCALALLVAPQRLGVLHKLDYLGDSDYIHFWFLQNPVDELQVTFPAFMVLEPGFMKEERERSSVPLEKDFKVRPETK